MKIWVVATGLLMLVITFFIVSITDNESQTKEPVVLAIKVTEEYKTSPGIPTYSSVATEVLTPQEISTPQVVQQENTQTDKEPMSKEEFMEMVIERKETLLAQKSPEAREKYEQAQERKRERQERKEHKKLIKKVYKEEIDAWRNAKREAKRDNDKERLNELERNKPNSDEIEKLYVDN